MPKKLSLDALKAHNRNVDGGKTAQAIYSLRKLADAVGQAEDRPERGAEIFGEALTRFLLEARDNGELSSTQLIEPAMRYARTFQGEGLSKRYPEFYSDVIDAIYGEIGALLADALRFISSDIKELWPVGPEHPDILMR